MKSIKKLASILSAVLASLLLSTGMAAANTGTIDTTGPDSTNTVEFANDTDVDLNNDTDVDADVDVDQDAESGKAEVENNTTGEDAVSGDSENTADVEADLSIDNSSSSSAALQGGGCGCGDDEGTIDMTGPDSTNEITFNNTSNVNVDNDTDVDFDVDVDQDADSGDAEVSHNTTGGGAMSGNVSNTSSTVFTLSVTN